MEIVEIIRLVAPEFNDISDEDLSKWVDISKPFVSKKQFGKMYNTALAYLICHKLKMAGYGESLNVFGDESVSASSGYGVTSISAGDTSVSFGNAQGAAGSSSDIEYSLTPYGLQFAQIKRGVIVPITCSGLESL